MVNIIITVISDDIEKSKEFAKYLAGNDLFKIELETKDKVILRDGHTTIQAITATNEHRGCRHHKIYVDKKSPVAIHLVDKVFRCKLLPIFSPLARYQLEVKNQIEYLNFDNELKYGNK